MNSAKFSLFGSLALLLTVCLQPTAKAGDRVTVNFDRDWRFHLGDVENGQKADIDDTSWRQLDVPHDWSIEGGEIGERQNLPLLSIVEGKWQFHRGDNPDWKKPTIESRRLGDRSIAELVERSLRLQRRALLRLVSPHDRDSRKTCRARRSSSISARSMIATKHSSTARRSAPRATCRRNYATAWETNRLYKIDPKLVRAGENVVAVRVYNGESKGGMYDAGATTVRSEGPFDPLSPAGDGGGYLNGGIGWYRKTFATPAGSPRTAASRSSSTASTWTAMSGSTASTSAGIPTASRASPTT